jgi:3-hydroxybutyryl-CoA dehydrogenase
MRFQTIGVVGAGVMGAGVAQNLAQTGHEVVLVDVGQAQLDRCRDEIKKSIRLQGLLDKSAKKVSSAEVLGRIRFTTDYEELAAASYLVENVVEKWPVKEEVYRRIDAICHPDCHFAANTSCISITKIGGVTKRPERIVGMHFMNPVPLKPMVEVIRGHYTTDASVEAAREFLAQMGKECIVVNDMPGFVSNRVLMLTINEAIFVVQDQVAAPEDVDRLFKTCFSHKMGPLETGDLIGLDTILFSLEVLYESFNDSKYRPAPLLKKMVDAGLHGRKSGRGFYNYEPTLS